MKFKGFVSIGCGKHVRNSMGSLSYDLDCLDCQRQPMMAWWSGSPPKDMEQALTEARTQLQRIVDLHTEKHLCAASTIAAAWIGLVGK